MKRARQEEDDPSISMPGRQMEVWNNTPLMHQNIASYLHRFADFLNLAMTTKRLYAFFCENDETVQCYHTFGTGVMARRFYNAKQRRDHLVESAVPRCIDFVWHHDCDINLKSDLAEEIIYRTATRGVLGIFRRYAAWVRPEKQAFLYRHLISQMAKSGCDKHLCLLYNQASYWLPNWKPTQSQFQGIFSSVAANALRVPNFFALLYQQCLTILKQETPDLNAPRILQVSALISVIGANTFDPEAVRHFWKTECSGQVFHDCCLAATQQAVFEDAAVDPPFYERASIRLAWVAQTFLGDKVVDPTNRARKQWNFAADPEIGIPQFQFRTECIKYHSDRHEGDITIDFQMDALHLRLHGTVPWQYSGFDGEGLGSDAETR